MSPILMLLMRSGVAKVGSSNENLRLLRQSLPVISDLNQEENVGAEYDLRELELPQAVQDTKAQVDQVSHPLWLHHS